MMNWPVNAFKMPLRAILDAGIPDRMEMADIEDATHLTRDRGAAAFSGYLAGEFADHPQQSPLR